METIINGGITVSMIVGILVKITMLLLLLLSFIMLRQSSMMAKVVNFPIGGNIRMLTWSYTVLMLLLTVIVIVV